MANLSEMDQVVTCIREGKNFLLSGGAGSGKTYTLVEVLKTTFKEFPLANVACITYTNAAVAEIEGRFNHKSLHVSTIHDFLWSNIKNFQYELVECICELSKEEKHTSFRIEKDKEIAPSYFRENSLPIEYKDFLRIKSGIISHDELIVVAELMFKRYIKLCDIVKDKYNFIFVDEYQDTNQNVVEILLCHLKKSQRKNIIGFFGDSMQSIYDDGVGDLNKFIGKDGGVTEVQKKQNRRNPLSIIKLANLLRNDTLSQEPSTDPLAPNMDKLTGEVKLGQIRFLHSSHADIDSVKKYLRWNFGDTLETKELNLTHNLIADKAGFRGLMDIYDKDQVIAYRNRIKDYIKDNEIEGDFSAMTFGEVVDYLSEGKVGAAKNKLLPTSGMQAFINENVELYLYATRLPYSQFQRLYVNKEQLIDDKTDKKSGGKRDDLIRHLLKIEANLALYREGKISEFLRKTDFRVSNLAQKRKLKELIDSLSQEAKKTTIAKVIEEADASGICKIDDKLLRFMESSKYVYDRVKAVDYGEVRSLYRYINGFTPFSTQHKTKGREFDKVLVVLDNGKWNKYNFENLFLGEGKESVLARTQKLFYVCCTRAKSELAIFFHEPSEAILKKAGEWFGARNIINLDSIK